MSTLNSTQAWTALALKSSKTMPSAAPSQPSTQHESSHATFSRLLERSRAEAASARPAPTSAARQDTSPAPDTQAARHAPPKESASRGQGARAEASDADQADTRARASSPPRGRGTDAARSTDDHAQDDEASAESSSIARVATDEDAPLAVADAAATDLLPPALHGLPPVPVLTPVPPSATEAGAAAADSAVAVATGTAATPPSMLDPSGGRIGPANPSGAGGAGAPWDTAAAPTDGRSSGLAQQAVTVAEPSALDMTPSLAAAPEAALVQLAALSGRAGQTDEARKRPLALDSVPAGTAVLSAPGMGHLIRASDSPALPTATVSTAVTDTGFQDALATQVSVFARGGMSQAELHLNPADMGPVSVHITMNGDQARVDFGADRAQTRQAIEAGWAALAASLQDAGFTLSGGGVSEQAGRQAAEQQAAAPQGRSNRATTALESDPATTSIVAARPQAGAALDLYA